MVNMVDCSSPGMGFEPAQAAFVGGGVVNTHMSRHIVPPEMDQFMTHLYVADLRLDTTAAQLFQVFGRFGECNIQLIPKYNQMSASIEYISPLAAKRALETIHQAAIRGRTVRVFSAEVLDTLLITKDNRILITDLDTSVEAAGLSNMCGLFGTVVDCKIEESHEDNTSLGRGSVQFMRPDEAALAIKHLNQMKVGEKVLTAELYKPSFNEPLFTGLDFSSG